MFVYIWIHSLEPVLAAPSIVEAVKPAEEVAGNWFYIRIAFQNIYFSFSEQILVARSVIEIVKRSDEEASNFHFTRAALQTIF